MVHTKERQIIMQDGCPLCTGKQIRLDFDQPLCVAIKRGELLHIWECRCLNCKKLYYREFRLPKEYFPLRITQMISAIDENLAREKAAAEGLFFQAKRFFILEQEPLPMEIDVRPTRDGTDICVTKHEIRLYQDRKTKRVPLIDKLTRERLPAILVPRTDCLFFTKKQIECIRSITPKADKSLIIKHAYACKSPQLMVPSHAAGITGISPKDACACACQLWNEGVLLDSNGLPRSAVFFGRLFVLGEPMLMMLKLKADIILSCQS